MIGLYHGQSLQPHVEKGNDRLREQSINEPDVIVPPFPVEPSECCSGRHKQNTGNRQKRGVLDRVQDRLSHVVLCQSILDWAGFLQRRESPRDYQIPCEQGPMGNASNDVVYPRHIVYLQQHLHILGLAGKGHQVLSLGCHRACTRVPDEALVAAECLAKVLVYWYKRNQCPELPQRLYSKTFEDGELTRVHELTRPRYGMSARCPLYEHRSRYMAVF